MTHGPWITSTHRNPAHDYVDPTHPLQGSHLLGMGQGMPLPFPPRPPTPLSHIQQQPLPIATPLYPRHPTRTISTSAVCLLPTYHWTRLSCRLLQSFPTHRQR